MTDNIYTPFTYHIAWTNIDKHYYGVRYAEGCQPSDLWSSYFTSSKLVFDYRQQYGEPDVIEIRRTFDDADSAVAWEHKVLQRLNVLESDNWLNQCIGGEKMLFKKHTLETRAKMSAINKGENNPNYGKSPHNRGKSTSPETKAKQSAANKGKTKSLETRAKMSAARKGTNNPNYGKSPSSETRAKMSAAKKGNQNKKRQKEITGS